MTELSEAAKSDRRKLRITHEIAYGLFLDKLEVVPTPERYPLPYGICDEARSRAWPYMPLVDLMISGDLRETINQLNAWREWLLHLTVWTEVIDQLDDKNAWAIQHSHVDPLAHVCLMQPSAVRDRFGHIATHAIHQANLCTIDSYRDRLKQDAQTHPLSRKQLEAQLSDIGQHWSKAKNFLAALERLDTKNYRQATHNYRNLVSHAIAPRFRLGITNMVVRSVCAATQRIQQSDGTYLHTEDPRRKAVSYGFGGMGALDLGEVYALSLEEYEKAAASFDAYSNLLREIISSLPAKGTP